MDKFPITIEGFYKMEQEIKLLKTVERPNVIKAIAEARAHGDLKENAEYHAAREKQSFIEGRVLELEDKMARSEMIDISKLSGSSVKFGATVTVVDEDTGDEITYQIVGEYEADISKNRIALTAPLARALMGKSAGDSVEVRAPGGTRTLEILAVQFIPIIL
ncbi:MAG: transcription elongation factor GreA [Alphaproteobacteria bacterium]|nr:MAG: transcription elongation factor GreA [Alphaproteobacteria bacterium]TAF15647.1 MAG: transcription elongation factor GreA [Alphaproteobacteria bacterium]TAF41084.1 MAG: transcription elongation factor GreA [Alphaproteobacteria bacterium]TAF76190.1 MAG: transcription elongation factor GreA [Alphaproteobacteria bacterium]